MSSRSSTLLAGELPGQDHGHQLLDEPFLRPEIAVELRYPVSFALLRLLCLSCASTRGGETLRSTVERRRAEDKPEVSAVKTAMTEMTWNLKLTTRTALAVRDIRPSHQLARDQSRTATPIVDTTRRWPSTTTARISETIADSGVICR